MLHHVPIQIRLVHSSEVTLATVISRHSLLMRCHVFAETCLLAELITTDTALINFIIVIIGMISLNMQVEEDLLFCLVVAPLTLELHIAM